MQHTVEPDDELFVVLVGDEVATMQVLRDGSEVVACDVVRVAVSLAVARATGQDRRALELALQLADEESATASSRSLSRRPVTPRAALNHLAQESCARAPGTADDGSTVPSHRVTCSIEGYLEPANALEPVRPRVAKSWSHGRSPADR